MKPEKARDGGRRGEWESQWEAQGSGEAQGVSRGQGSGPALSRFLAGVVWRMLEKLIRWKT